jgi:hypothetical protein
MAPQDVRESAMPAVALTTEHPQRLRHLGPGDGVRNELDPPRSAVSCPRRRSRAIRSMSRQRCRARSPPTSSTDHARTARSPETMRLPPEAVQPQRPNRNARRYSTTWMPGSGRRGTARLTTRRCADLDSLATRMVPRPRRPRAVRNGRTIRQQAVGLDQRVGVHRADQLAGGRLSPAFRRPPCRRSPCRHEEVRLLPRPVQRLDRLVTTLATVDGVDRADRTRAEHLTVASWSRR